MEYANSFIECELSKNVTLLGIDSSYQTKVLCVNTLMLLP